ncbi:class I SAM-dependent methyltransferase [Micromonospora sp. NPDC005553]|uniref:class I SAM-dependent methyltransferase n=1 Tax=unclassified Micromonospora TaxID=2617518 RepID=UPI0033B33069
MTYTAEFAEIYEFIYRSRGKDWAAEAETLTRLIRDRRPEAASLLDVACGTGAHLATFAGTFDEVAGVELSEPMRATARTRLPGVPVHDGDMRDFRLGRRFDAVTCMFNAIGYLGSVAELRQAVWSMAQHLEPGGVLVVEPWWFPERFLDGHLAVDSDTDGTRAVARMSHTTRTGRMSHLEVRFLVGDAGGIREFTQTSHLMLFSRDEYLGAFADAGCPAEFLDDGLTGRGLFVGQRG